MVFYKRGIFHFRILLLAKRRRVKKIDGRIQEYIRPFVLENLVVLVIPFRATLGSFLCLFYFNGTLWSPRQFHGSIK